MKTHAITQIRHSDHHLYHIMHVCFTLVFCAASWARAYVYSFYISCGKMNRIQGEFKEETSYWQRIILDHLDVLPSAEVFNPSIPYGRERPFVLLGLNR